MPTPDNPTRILLIDDERINADLLEGMLGSVPGLALRYLPDPSCALAVAAEFGPSVILADLRMPTMDGFELIRMLKADAAVGDVPVLMLSSEVDPHSKARGFEAGAADYIVKWPDRVELAARVLAHSNAWHGARERERAREALAASQRELLERTRELAEAQASLYEARKLEAIGQLTTGIAHDFNNVLQIISGHLQLMRLEHKGDDKAGRRIESATEGVRRGAALAAQLLAFARRQPLQPVALDAAAALQAMDARIAKRLGTGVSCALDAGAGQYPMSVDPVQFEAAMLGIVANASEAMEHGGTVTIAVDCCAAPDGGAARLAPGDYVRIRVTDTGAGMPAEVMRCAFEPFYTTRPSPRRAGLGLSMAFGFASQSGGGIELASAVGHGTTVTLYFPRASGECAAPPPPLPATGGELALRGSETILVVEDEAPVRAASAEILRQLGYRVLEAGDGDAALGLICSGVPIDLVFTDMVMPGSVRSADIAAAAREHLPGARLLFTSGYPRDGMGAAGPASDTPLLHKPYRLDDLARLVRELLEARP